MSSINSLFESFSFVLIVCPSSLSPFIILITTFIAFDFTLVRYQQEYRLFTIVRYNYNYRDYNTPSKPNMHANRGNARKKSMVHFYFWQVFQGRKCSHWSDAWSISRRTLFFRCNDVPYWKRINVLLIGMFNHVENV